MRSASTPSTAMPSDTCLEITAKHSGFSAQAPGLADTASAKAIEARHAQWAKQLPEAPARSVGRADGVRRRQPGGAVRALRLAHRQRREGAVEPASGRVRPWRPARPGRQSRHGGGRLAADRRQLSRPGSEGAHPRSGARSQGRAVGAAHRPSQEGRHGQGGRAAARRHGLAARAAASGRRIGTGDRRADRRGRGAAGLPRRRRGRGGSRRRRTAGRTPSRRNDCRQRGGFGRPAPVSPSNSNPKARPSRRAFSLSEPCHDRALPITPTPAPTLTDWETKRAEHERRDAELRPANKTAVFDALAAAGITIVIVVFDGYGDSGQIEDIEAKAGERRRCPAARRGRDRAPPSGARPSPNARR